MTLPVAADQPVITACNRISFVSNKDTVQRYVYGLKTFLLARGFTIKWSSNGTTGPSGAGDTTDRLTTPTDWAVRATVIAAAQAWIVLVDGWGSQLLIAYTGASDDCFVVGYSPGANYSLPGTSTNAPALATDELIPCGTTARINGPSMVENTASGDCLWSGWCTSDAKSYSFAVARNGIWTGTHWGIQKLTPSPLLAGSVSWAKNAVAFGLTPAQCGSTVFGNQAFQQCFNGSSGQGALARVNVSAVNYTCNCDFGCEGAGAVVNIQSYFNSGGTPVFPELQAGGQHFQPIDVSTKNNVGCRGKLGRLIDWYGCGGSGAVVTCGKTDGVASPNLLKWIHMGAGSSSDPGFVRPWDGVTTPVMI